MLEKVRLVNKMRFRLKRRKISTRLFQVAYLPRTLTNICISVGGADLNSRFLRSVALHPYPKTDPDPTK
jgi:hypothetical protein